MKVKEEYNMYINKSSVKVWNEERIKGNEVKFIISVTGDINDGDYCSSFQFLNKDEGIKAIEELCQLYEWELKYIRKNERVPNFNLCPIEFEFLKIPRNDTNDYCHTIINSNVYKIDLEGKIYAIQLLDEISLNKLSL